MDNSEAVRKHQQIMSQQALFERHVQALKKTSATLNSLSLPAMMVFPSPTLWLMTKMPLEKRP